jgi:hypothetical protein
MNLKIFFTALAQLALAGVVLMLSHYGYGWMAAILVLLPPTAAWLTGGRSREALHPIVPQLILSLTVVTLLSLNKPPVGQPVFPVISQVTLATLYGLWLVVLARLQYQPRYALMVAGLHQLMAVSAIFLAAAFWHWPDVIVVALVWLITFALTWWYLSLVRERAAQLLAAAWALIAGQIAWALDSWQVNYVIKDGLMILPQAAIIILGLSYCFASIYIAHSSKRLSRRRLIEYVAIGGVLLAIVIAGTRWNGTT